MVGHRRSPSRALATTIGSPTSESITAAAKNDCPRTMPCDVWLRISAGALEPGPASEQGEHHQGLAGEHLDGRLRDPRERWAMNSLSHTAIPTPTGMRYAHRHRADDQGAEHRIEEAAGLALAHPRGGIGDKQTGTQVPDPLDQKVDDDGRRDRAEKQPEQPGQAEAEAI